MSQAPDFSIVTAVYNVGRYLDDFIASIDAQTLGPDRFEVIAVDDGSTDDSLERLRAWEARRPELVTVLSKENGGQSTARNLGLEHVRGTWVTFTDPDDVIAPDYLAEVAAFLERNASVSMVATRFMMLDDRTGAVTDTHPLRWRFADGSAVRDLAAEPEYFHASAPAAFLDVARLSAHEIRFDPRIRPNWEDGHFCARYLLTFDRPSVGFVATARYRYRRRADRSSTLQGSFADPGRFTTVPELGFLDALRTGASMAADGRPPAWLQNLVIYELSWYFSADEAHAGVRSAALGAVADRFHELLAEVLGPLDPGIVVGFRPRPLKPVWVDAMLHAYEAEAWHSAYAVVGPRDDSQGLVRISYRYTGSPPREELLGGGIVVEPMHAKVRSVDYFGRTLLCERIAWVSASKPIGVRLDGQDVDIVAEERRPPARMPRPARAQPRLRDRLVRRLARTAPVRRLFRDAWVLVDRIGDAGDNAERLFDHLRAHRRDINAWFVLDRDSADWPRLRRSHGGRVLAHGSLRWKLAMANCRHLVSSHADAPIVRSPAIRFLRRTWRFTFLQHGVIKDDLSRWLNPKPIDLFVTSTPQELASITADNTPYVYTTREAKLTGLPRFDRLLEIGGRYGPGARDLVLVAPTWRVDLVDPLVAGEHRRAISPAFAESAWARSWLGFLASDELSAAAAEHGLTIGFLPHPELQPALASLPIPAHVRALTFAQHDAQELFARAAVMVTDYSSMAFNAAYIDRPVVYFQFDAADLERGAHLGRPGYFDYERDGFGPVATTLDEAVARTVEIVRGSREPAAPFRARIEAAFPVRDGRCCERVTHEIESLTRPVTRPSRLDR